MPDTLHPPFPPNNITPRILQRWLDVNAQGGKLNRTRGYIKIPLDSIPNITLPALNISITNNFGFQGTFSLQDNNGNLLQTLLIQNGHTGIFTITNNAAKIYYTFGGPPPFPHVSLPTVGWKGTATLAGGSGGWNFVQAITYSDKILQFNGQTPRDFSLRIDQALQDFLDLFEGIFLITVANVFQDPNGGPNTVVRYRLTQDHGERIVAEQYNGQRIHGKFFQIEFWSLSTYTGTLVALPTPIIIYTSQLGNADYRYQPDFDVSPLHHEIVIEFHNNNPDVQDTFLLPLTFNANTINGLN